MNARRAVENFRKAGDGYGRRLEAAVKALRGSSGGRP